METTPKTIEEFEIDLHNKLVTKFTVKETEEIVKDVMFTLSRLRESLEIEHQKELMDAAKFMREQIAKEDVEWAEENKRLQPKKPEGDVSYDFAMLYIRDEAYNQALSDFISYKHNQIRE